MEELARRRVSSHFHCASSLWGVNYADEVCEKNRHGNKLIINDARKPILQSFPPSFYSVLSSTRTIKREMQLCSFILYNSYECWKSALITFADDAYRRFFQTSKKMMMLHFKDVFFCVHIVPFTIGFTSSHFGFCGLLFRYESGSRSCLGNLYPRKSGFLKFKKNPLASWMRCD